MVSQSHTNDRYIANHGYVKFTLVFTWTKIRLNSTPLYCCFVLIDVHITIQIDKFTLIITMFPLFCFRQQLNFFKPFFLRFKYIKFLQSYQAVLWNLFIYLCNDLANLGAFNFRLRHSSGSRPSTFFLRSIIGSCFVKCRMDLIPIQKSLSTHGKTHCPFWTNDIVRLKNNLSRPNCVSQSAGGHRN